MNKLLMLAALAEAGLGLILLVYPPIVVQLLLGGEIAGAGIIVSRFAGIALIGLGLACWPGTDGRPVFYGMLTYSVLALLYSVYIGITVVVAGGRRPCDHERSSSVCMVETTKASVPRVTNSWNGVWSRMSLPNLCDASKRGQPGLSLNERRLS